MNRLIIEYVGLKTLDTHMVLEKKALIKNHKVHTIIHHDMITTYYDDRIVSRLPIAGFTDEVADKLACDFYNLVNGQETN